jgi:hypothetical protein
MNSCFRIASAAGALLWCIGCASPSKVILTPPVSPAPTGRLESAQNGSLQVYSAREWSDADINEQEWRWNDDFGRNNFLYYPAHTDYVIYDNEGKLLERIRNARNPEDPEPARVPLQPGRYEIRAQAQDKEGTFEVRVPVIIQAGQTTTVRLVS